MIIRIKTNKTNLLKAYSISESMEYVTIGGEEFGRRDLEEREIPDFNDTIEIAFDEEEIVTDNIDDIVRLLSVQIEKPIDKKELKKMVEDLLESDPRSEKVIIQFKDTGELDCISKEWFSDFSWSDRNREYKEIFDKQSIENIDQGNGIDVKGVIEYIMDNCIG